ncbi:hypothetical protein NVV94_08710 [Pseudomonas sp. LS1212]|uniref:hypothetical protein n=1 Tax=Pseudomonas sp. LS1212 TaxID=2972478 RepID=UPI00215C00A8|nr:hypothetical protein [Pseudomonas sp. LS1212]UVJ45616.1 hypothetical protein NVV94_08710 [Pseudomonas sp. LS1212]
MSKPQVPAVIVALVALLLMSSCSLYHEEFKAPDVTEANYELRVVQVDDFGSWWNPAKAQDTINLIKQSAKTTNTYVVLFIHGWHHNADTETDTNYLDFKDTLKSLGDKLAAPEYATARQNITGNSTFKLIGVYVGWRGKSLPGVLDYATMWWRKTAAERVGDGDVSEFIERLHRIYLRTNALGVRSNIPQPDTRKPYMGLVSIGHSFGGQVLMKSIARPLEYYLTERAPRLASSLQDPSQTTPAEMADQIVPIDSFGDVNILLNPALEAYQYAKIDSLYRQIRFSYNQAPQLVVFSADNDSPRQFFFPIARGLTRLFRPPFSNDYQGNLYGEALGEFEPQRTHTMTLAPGTPDSLVAADYSNREVISHFDFTGNLSFAGMSLQRLPEHKVPNSPVAVVYTEGGIIDGHNGIFKPQFVEFLTKYIDFIEGKNLALRRERWEQRRGKARSQLEGAAMKQNAPLPDGALAPSP